MSEEQAVAPGQDSGVARVGLFMRQFARDEKKVPDVVNKMVDVIMRALAIMNGEAKEEPLFDRIEVGIPTDSRYKMRDCGKLKSSLSASLDSVLNETDRARVFVTEIPEGDNYVGLPNAAMRIFTDAEMDIMFILSPSASGNLTAETALDMCDAILLDHADVAPAIVPELADIVKKGIPQNTFCAYALSALNEVNGFDEMAAIAPENDPKNLNAGMEEVPTVLRMVGTHGRPFIAPVPLRGDFTPWKIPEEGTPEWSEHDATLATKRERAEAHAASEGIPIEQLEEYIHEKYRVKVNSEA